MEETKNNLQSADGESQNALKSYRQPKLTPLGGIHSLVRTNPGSGADIGGHGTNSAS